MDTEETLSLVAKQWALLQYHTGRLVLLARNGFHKRRSSHVVKGSFRSASL